ncbi:hypothetical protein D9613_005623 [Agrocybe pediades]|uniref:Uncharacterized protein n=1 Tax=Agrocybe pediades TaxID=84607 RepID=A0A8H4VNI5_9AGAR|nr:hypothetical protein D9613_005623 [Agrocybe pediades]
MAELHSGEDILPHIPDNLTLSQFMLDYQHEMRPARSSKTPCLVDDSTGKSLSFESLRLQTEYLANGLYIQYEIGERDTVMIFSSNHMNYPIVLWAVHKLGGIVSFSSPQSTAEELAYQLKIARVTYLVIHSNLLKVAQDAAHLVGMPSDRIILLDARSAGGAHDVFSLINIGGRSQEQSYQECQLTAGEGSTKIALLCWSSGTTGMPKAVAISHRALIANILQMAVHNHINSLCTSRDSRSYRPGDIALGVLPFYLRSEDVAGLVIGLHLTLFAAMTVVVIPKFDFPALLKSIAHYKINHLIIVPPIAVAFCKHPATQRYDFRHVKYVLIGAAPVSRQVQDSICRLCPAAQVGQAYGLTEMTTTLSMVSGSQRRGPIGSAGRLLPGIQARVIKPDGSLARCGERGELVVKGPGISLGYLHNQKATKETFRDGWVYTGDEVSLSADQEVFVHDRLKEFIKVKGVQVSPSEIEDCLLSHPDIAEACVIGIPDDYSGEIPVAYVALTNSAVDSLNGNRVPVSYYINSFIKASACPTTTKAHGLIFVLTARSRP